MAGNYSAVHRAFLQVCANRGTMGIVQALNILQDIETKHTEGSNAADETRLRAVVEEINGKLAQVEQKLVFVQLEMELPQSEFLVFSETTQSAVLKLPVTYTETECNYFKLLLKNIVTHEDYQLPTIAALNLCSSVTANTSSSSASSKRITKQRAQDLFDDWCGSGYLIDIDDSLCLGPRAIGEFGGVLRTKFSRFIHTCYLCSDLTFNAYSCPSGVCTTILNKRCAKQYLKKFQKCPKCKSKWEFSE